MAYDQIHIVDATSQMIEIALRSSTTGQLLTGKAYGDMTIKYQREGAAAATTVSVVTATKGSYTSGGFVETDIAGLYQFGIPNGALATGAKALTLTFACTGALDVVKRIVLVGADLRNANSLGLAYLGGDTFTRLGAPAGASVSADVAAIKAETVAILEDTGTTLPAALTAIDDFIDTEVAAIKAKTDNLPSDPADQSAVEAAITAATSGLATAANLATVDAVVDSILADTGTDGVLVATGAKTGYALTSTEHTNIADAILKRDWTAVSGAASRSVLSALRFLRNKWSISGATLTVTEEDDSTPAWTATLSTDAAADPVTGSDPA